MRKNVNLRWLWLSVLVFILDQLSKTMVVKRMALGQSHRVTGFLNVALAHNYGASFSFLGNASGWQRWFLILVVLVVVVVLLCWLGRMRKPQHLQACALSFILGGALGNLWDRIHLGYVNDFVDFHIRTWHFATFNIADSAITIGVVLLIFSMVVFGKRNASHE